MNSANLPDYQLVRGRVVWPDRLSEDEHSAWRDFCATTSALAHPFCSFAFTECVARVLPDVRVCILERGGRIEGFLPFQFPSRWRRAFRAADQIGGDLSDCFGVIARPGTKISPDELLAAAEIESLSFHHLAEDQLCFGLTGEQPRSAHRITIGDDPAEYWRRLKATNKGFAVELERRQRKLIETCGPLRFEFDVSDPNRKLTQLIIHKRRQYHMTGVGDALAAGWKRALILELARSADPDCTGVYSELYAGDTWVASHFGLRNRHTLHYWFPVYNRTLANLAPGHLLLRRIVEDGAACGIRVIDRGEGDQPHKTAWLTDRYIVYRGLWHRPSIRAFVHRANLTIAWRLRAQMRRSGGYPDRPKE